VFFSSRIPQSKIRADRSPLSKNMHESGDRSALILDWGILDEKNTITSTLIFGRLYKVRVYLVALKKGINPNVGFFFSDVRGNEIAGSAINHEDIYLGPQEKEAKSTIEFTIKATIRPETYFLNIGCSEFVDGNLVSYHRLYSLTEITITGTKPIVGTAYLTPMISIKPDSQNILHGQ